MPAPRLSRRLEGVDTVSCVPRWTLAFLMSVAACTHRVEPRCPPPHVETMLNAPVDVELSIVDDSHPRISCNGVAPTVVRVQIDDRPWCEVSMSCAMSTRAPSPTVECRGPKVEPGEHRFAVSVVGKPASLTERSMSLPAFAKNGATLTVGAYVSVSVGEDLVVFDPPTASKRGGL